MQHSPRFQYRSTGGADPAVDRAGLPRHSFFPQQNDNLMFGTNDGEPADMFRDFDDDLRRSFRDLRGGGGGGGGDRGPRPRFFENDPFFRGSGFSEGLDRDWPSFSPQFQFDTKNRAFPTAEEPTENPQQEQERFRRQESEPHPRPQGPSLHRSFTQPSNSPFFHPSTAGGGALPPHSQQPYSNEPQNEGRATKIRVIPVQRDRSMGTTAEGKQKPTVVEVNHSPQSNNAESMNMGGGVGGAGDKRMRYRAPSDEDIRGKSPMPPKAPPVITIDDYSNRCDSAASPRQQKAAHSPAISEKAIPMPAPAIPMPPPPDDPIPLPAPTTDLKQQPFSSNTNVDAAAGVEHHDKTPKVDLYVRNNRTEAVEGSGRRQNENNAVSIGEKGQNKSNVLASISTGDQLIKVLDETEIRVEQLRDAAAHLELEKELLLDTLNKVVSTGESIRLETSELDELKLASDRVLKRCKTVDVAVNTPRDEEQSRALDEVNGWIRSVVNRIHDEPKWAKETFERFLNACCPDEPIG